MLQRAWKQNGLTQTPVTKTSTPVMAIERQRSRRRMGTAIMTTAAINVNSQDDHDRKHNDCNCQNDY